MAESSGTDPKFCRCTRQSKSLIISKIQIGNASGDPILDYQDHTDSPVTIRNTALAQDFGFYCLSIIVSLSDLLLSKWSAFYLNGP